jgi:hypothetical protein
MAIERVAIDRLEYLAELIRAPEPERTPENLYRIHEMILEELRMLRGRTDVYERLVNALRRQ